MFYFYLSSFSKNSITVILNNLNYVYSYSEINFDKIKCFYCDTVIVEFLKYYHLAAKQ